MASETSAVLVAVRVRPLNARESPLECTVSVLDDRTVTVTDINSVAPGVSTGGGGYQHVFTFDRIFWSIPPHVLPVNMTDFTPQVHSPHFSCAESVTPSAISRTTSIGFGVSSRSSSITPGVLDNSVYSAMRRPVNNLPCFAPVPEYDDQASVYAFIGPRMYGSVMAGYNSCLFAYGQTGSGKTHSVIGPPESFAPHSVDCGIMPRLCEDLFEKMRKEREEDETISYNVECSFFEIYCERVRDLLVHCNSTSSSYGSNSVAGVGGGGNTPSLLLSLSTTPSLRVRQHPERGPYVEGLTLVKVRDANAVMQHLMAGLRERVTAETRMNEHSSRSHAILQLHITRVMVVREETAVVTKTRVCKVNLVDLAGSERVAQSGASGDRFEEARNINLSLTTLGRVILQLTDKQAGKHVVPCYRDSVLTWLLSDSLGGNSKTIMLATIAPSAYCYQQTLSTLRFAGLTKKVINVATVNEDRHFQKLIATLREQIVKLTLQLEEGKAADVYHEEIRALRSARDELEAQIDSMRVTISTMVPATEVTAVQRRVADLEETTGQLLKENNQLQRQLLTTTTELREKLAQKCEEIMKLRDSLVRKDGEVQEWIRRYRAETVIRETTPKKQQTQQHRICPDVMRVPQFSPVIAERSHRREELENQIDGLKKELKTERQRAEEAVEARNRLQFQLDALRQENSDNVEILESTQRRLLEKVHALDVAQSDLAATRTMLRVERLDNSAAERERELVAQLERTHEDYLREKQTSVNLLMRISEVERQVSHMKKDVSLKGRDINELEHLLLEETETSERYYIQMRYNHDVFTIAMSFVCKLPFLLENYNAISKYNHFDNGAGYSREDVNTYMWEQAVCECVQLEAYDRVLLEQECLSALLELHGQKAILYELGVVGGTNSELVSLRILSTEMSEEQKRLRRKIESLEAMMAKLEKERLLMQTALQNSENTRDRLSRQVDDMMEESERLQQCNDALIQKIVEMQSSRDVFIVHSDGVKDSSPLQTEETARDSAREEQLQLHLEEEVAQYQEQIGVLHAQLERERNGKMEKTRSLQREKEQLQREMKRVRDECRASLKESTQIVKDYEVHIKELQETITSLRSALEEEYMHSDKARDALRRVEMEKRDILEELRQMTMSRNILQTDLDDSERRFNEFQKQILELHLAYDKMEQQLNGMSLPMTDVYVTMDRNDGVDGDKNWMEKALREKEVLEQQKQDVRRLNEELLATVRLRNQSLRDVHRQITKMQRGGVSPDTTDALSVNDNSPLGAQLSH